MRIWNIEKFKIVFHDKQLFVSNKTVFFNEKLKDSPHQQHSAPGQQKQLVEHVSLRNNTLDRATAFKVLTEPDPVSEKKVLNESSATPTESSEGMVPSGWIPCSKQ